MKTKHIAIALVACATVLSCKKDKTTETVEEVIEVVEVMKDKKLTMKLEAKSDSNATGNIVFKEENGVVSMTAVLSGLSEGTHAIHIHDKADCSSVDGKSTGGHWNPTAQPHGAWGDATGYHRGDIGNFEADANGNGVRNFTTDEWCIGCGDKTKDITGKAIIVHQGTDDLKSQPSGAAGARISCGGIIM